MGEPVAELIGAGADPDLGHTEAQEARGAGRKW